MRKWFIPLCLGLCALAGVAGAARAQDAAEAIPAEFIQQFAPFAVQLIQQQFPEPAVRVDPNAEKTVGYHVRELVGLLMMPDRNLTAKAVEEATDKEIPLAILATKSLSVDTGNGPAGQEQLALADVNGMVKIPVFFLSVRGKGAERSIEVYSRNGKPLASVPLKKQQTTAESVALKLTNIDLEKKKLNATIQVGSYEATVPLGVVEF